MFENKMEKSLFASLLQAKRATLRMFTLNKNHYFWRQNSKIQNWKTKELLKIKMRHILVIFKHSVIFLER